MVNMSKITPYERSLRLSDSNTPKKANRAMTPNAPLPKLTTISCVLSVAGLGGNGAGIVGVGAGVKVAVAVAMKGTNVKVGAAVGVSVRVAVSTGE